MLNQSFYVLIFEGATVKAGTQEHGTKCSMEVRNVVLHSEIIQK